LSDYKRNRKAGDTVIHVIFINPSYDLLLKVNWDKAYSSVPKEKCSTFLKLTCYRIFQDLGVYTSDNGLLCKPYKTVLKNSQYFHFRKEVTERTNKLLQYSELCEQVLSFIMLGEVLW